ncbi:hypothetical protein F1188_16230 [Roseospira marina]|uniref:Uncharacterized protein n=1 Tax=Roseospira marina TaxID=140057 RepID=A0A5M6I8Y9_9PROT|nr:hypothetical protein [Roseospira marina]KAA5604407.1 hypothetical protein F1188_16230 [Roseospira marina]
MTTTSSPWVVNLRRNCVWNARRGLSVKVRIYVDPVGGVEVCGRPIGPMPEGMGWDEIQSLINQGTDAFLDAFVRTSEECRRRDLNPQDRDDRPDF